MDMFCTGKEKKTKMEATTAISYYIACFNVLCAFMAAVVTTHHIAHATSQQKMQPKLNSFTRSFPSGVIGVLPTSPASSPGIGLVN